MLANQVAERLRILSLAAATGYDPEKRALGFDRGWLPIFGKAIVPHNKRQATGLNSKLLIRT